MRRRWWVVIGVVAALSAVVAVNVKRNQTIGRNGSTVLAGGQPLGITDAPAGFDVVYRVERKVGGSVTVSTDHVSVLRPFSSRIESLSGPPPGRARTSVAVASLGRNQSGAPGRAPLTIELPPAVAAADVRIGAVIQDALDQGVLQRRERRRVAGRECQVFRSGGLFRPARSRRRRRAARPPTPASTGTGSSSRRSYAGAAWCSCADSLSRCTSNRRRTPTSR